MYSGHVAHIMTLYEAFSNDYSLSSKGWEFYNSQYKKLGKLPSYYTLKKLIEIINNQSKKSPISAFPCEPSIIYTACNQHPVIASKLYDKIHNTNYSSIGNHLKFFNWIRENGTHKKILGLEYFSLEDSYYIGATQENLEKLFNIYPNLREKFRHIIKNRDGLVGLDGWVNQWLEIWRPNTKEAINSLNYGRGNLTFNKAWKKFKKIKGIDLWYIRNDFISSLGMFNFTIASATSFAIAGMGGYLSKNKSLVKGSIYFLDWCNGQKFQSNKSSLPMWYFNTEKGNLLYQCNKILPFKKNSLDSIMNTANILQGIVYNSKILRNLYNGNLLKNVFKHPHILSINYNIGVRFAKFIKNNHRLGHLKINLVSMNSINKYVKIIINNTNFFKLCYNLKDCYSLKNNYTICKFRLKAYNDKNIILCFNSVLL